MAEQKGFPITAEQACHSAWFDVDSNRLAPRVQSERLYDLGRIKRQLGKFAEAEPLLRQALGIEESVSGRSSPAYGRRLVELSLILAGQGKWPEGAVFLESALEITDQFPEREQITTAKVLGHYAWRLRDTDQSELAERFERKAVALRIVEKADAEQAD